MEMSQEVPLINLPITPIDILVHDDNSGMPLWTLPTPSKQAKLVKALVNSAHMMMGKSCLSDICLRGALAVYNDKWVVTSPKSWRNCIQRKISADLRLRKTVCSLTILVYTCSGRGFSQRSNGGRWGRSLLLTGEPGW